MQIEEILGLTGQDQIREGIIRPSDQANGWMISIEFKDGSQIPLTDDHDHPRIYHDLDQATQLLQELQVKPVKIIESF
ncbi:hypothetical protein [Amphritea balenae]|uniref:Thymidylate kinase n=1 Tax=Amphritea balenae TaxID=452629 RepID=A0A3P1SRV2_9GAMM|nr:hypothetical protein [Amphritea balenae]RRC99903.1 hypothetical protein EHS89_06685 [Amphritea balenae]GGK74939.1 hypothetical protein GCM10007941_26280 [Amphritea balenae]